MSARIKIPREKLEELYSDQKLSTRKIAEIFGCEHTAIRNRLKEYKIEIRRPKIKINISKEKLKNLYVDKNLSTQKIAKLLGIGSCSVYYKLKEANIETRKKKIFNITKMELERLYLEKKLSCSQIAKLYNFDSVTVFKKLKNYSIKTRNRFESNIKYPKKIFHGDNELKAYMIGFRLGDLNVKSLQNEATVIVKSSTTKEDQVNLIKSVYGRYGHFWIKKYGEVFSTMTFLDKSFNFLVKKEDNIEDWIRQENKSFLAFLAGYTDAEGNIGVSGKVARFRIRTYNKNILLQIHKKLHSIGIKSIFGLASKKGVYKKIKYNKDCWGVFVNAKKDLSNLFGLLKPYIKHEKRYNDLLIAEKNLAERIKKYNVRL